MVLATTGSCLGSGPFRDSPWIPKLRTTEHLDAALAVATRSLHIGFEGTPTIHNYSVRPFVAIRPGRPTGQEFKSITQVLNQFYAEGRPEDELWPGELAMSEELTLYDYVWLLRPEDTLLDSLRSTGWVSEQQWPHLHLMRWQPCFVDVLAPTIPADGLWLEYGWVPLGPEAPYASVPFRPHGNMFRAAVQRAPCSAVWLRARAVDGSTAHYAGTDRNGLLVLGADTGRTGRMVECRIADLETQQ
jgi:hypothetical protein